MRVKPLCTTCKQPTIGPHREWCSRSDGALSALRASLPAAKPSAFPGGEMACRDCGYVKCECTIFSTDPLKGSFSNVPTWLTKSREMKAWLGPRVLVSPPRAVIEPEPQTDEDFARERGWVYSSVFCRWAKGNHYAWLADALEQDDQWATCKREPNLTDCTFHASLRLAVDAAEREIAATPVAPLPSPQPLVFSVPRHMPESSRRALLDELRAQNANVIVVEEGVTLVHPTPAPPASDPDALPAGWQWCEEGPLAHGLYANGARLGYAYRDNGPWAVLQNGAAVLYNSDGGKAQLLVAAREIHG